MSDAIASLSPKLAANSSVRKIADALTTTRAKNRDLREEASQAQTPFVQTAATQGGALAAAAITVFAPEGKAGIGMGAASAAALAYALFTRSPWAVSLANGLATPITYAKGLEWFARAKTASE